MAKSRRAKGGTERARDDTPTGGGRVWLLLLFKLPSESSTNRVYVWRRLRTLGGVYLQHSVCVLPDRADLRAGFEELKRDIEGRTGTARLIPIRLTDAADDADLVRQFQGQAEEEYGEFLGKCRDFHAEMSRERECRNLTFAELEENEMEVGKIRAWLPKIRERDFFTAVHGPEATTALAACEKDFVRFSQEVGEAQGLSPPGRKPKRAQKPG